MNDRICVIVYDGLDINLVDEFGLENLKQKEYGKVDISDFKFASTPILSASFLAGKNLQDHFIDPASPTVEKLHTFLSKIDFLIKSNISNGLAIRLKKAFRNGGFDQKIRKGTVNSSKKVEDIVDETILDVSERPRCVNVPTVNQKNLQINYTLKDVIEDKISEEEFESMVWENFKENKQEFLESLKISDFVMAWFKPTDLLGHLYRTNLEKMSDVYKKMDKLTKEVNETFEGWVLVLGDHGMEPLGDYGDHTNVKYGFYSSNQELGLNNPKITDFYSLITEEDISLGKGILNTEEGLKEREDRDAQVGEDKEELISRLKDLGYF